MRMANYKVGPTRNTSPIPSWAVGTWVSDTAVKGISIQIIATLGDDATYTCDRRTTDESGQFKAWIKEEGMYRVDAQAFVFAPSGGQNKDVTFTQIGRAHV